MNALPARYAGFRAPPLGYATVRDYCDSHDAMNDLATFNGDLKDVQRPWMVKAVLGHVPPGGRLLEIGAGQPLVADLLVQLGYGVTVVDPYDGSGNGPREFEAFRRAYPGVEYVRETFTDALSALEPRSFDAIYSISVLEHVPIPEVRAVCAGMQRFIRPGGWHLHAIDHVLKGAGDLHHLERLFELADRMGFEKSALVGLLRQAEDDVETYFLSAESHNRWRGSVPYESFPMRRCISLQLAIQQAA
jgi:hypothetical protein